MKRNKKKKHIIELEEKQKKEIENLEKDFNQALSSDLDELKKELEKSSQVNTILLIGTNNKKDNLYIYYITLRIKVLASIFASFRSDDNVRSPIAMISTCISMKR